MTRYMKIIAILPALIVGGCVQVDPEIAARANYVRTASSEQVATCKFLGPVSTFGAALEGGMSAAMTKARQGVAAAGGTHMVVVTANTTYNGYTHGQVQAEAYAC
jgi:hypothetical protein